MRRPSSRARPHLVTLFRITWGTDADGGLLELARQPVPKVPCSVQPGEPVLEQVNGRWSMTVVWALKFDDDPGLNPMDAAQWADPFSGRVHNMVCAGLRPRAGRGATHEYKFIEKR